MATSDNTSSKLDHLYILLGDLPKSIIEGEKFYYRSRFEPTALQQSLSDTYIGALHLRLELAFGALDDKKLFGFIERGPGLQELVNVLRDALESKSGDKDIIRRWVDKLTESAIQVYKKAEVEVPSARRKITKTVRAQAAEDALKPKKLASPVTVAAPKRSTGSASTAATTEGPRRPVSDIRSFVLQDKDTEISPENFPATPVINAVTGAEAITFASSDEEDEVQPRRPATVSVTEIFSDEESEPVSASAPRKKKAVKEVPIPCTKVAGTRNPLPERNALKRKRTLSASSGSGPAIQESTQHQAKRSKAGTQNESDYDAGLEGDLEPPSTDGATDFDMEDDETGRDHEAAGVEDDEDSFPIDEDEQRYRTAKAKENEKRQPRAREKRARDLMSIFKASVYDAKDGKGEKSGHWCTLCIQANGGKKKSSFFHVGSNSSLRNHISRVPGHYEVYVAGCEKEHLEPHARAKPKKHDGGQQSTLDAFATTVTPTPHWTKEGLLDHIIELIVDSDSAFRLVERGAFRRLLIYQRPKTQDSDIPRRTLIREAILAKLEKLDGIDKANIKAIKSLISMTFDGWTSRPGNPFLSLTIHFIDAPEESPRDWVLKSQLLALDKVNGSHSGANIAEIITSIIKKYDFGEKVGWWTADNVTANDTAIAEICRTLDPEGKLLVPKERRGHCIEHAIHLAAHHFVKGLNGASDAKIRARLHGHPTASMDYDGDEFDDLDDDEEVDVSMEPEGAEDECEIEEWSAGDIIGKVLAFVRQVRLSPQAREFLKKTCRDADDAELELLTWIRTRWASLHNCFDRVISLRAGIDRFFARADRADVLPTLKNKRYSDFEFSEDDWTKIKLIHSVLKEPAAAQQELSSEKIPTVSRALPILETLQTRWEEMLDGPSMQGWSAAWPTCASVLDPTIKLEYFNVEWDEAWIKKHMARFEKTYKKYAEKVPTTSGGSTVRESSSTASSKGKHYASAALDRARRDRQLREREQTQTQDEIQRYLNSPLEVPDENGAPFDVVRWWGHHQMEYPVLARIARDYLAIQGSSVASERAFSAAGNSVTLKRNQLSPRMVEALQRLKGAYRDGRLSTVDEAWLHLDEAFDDAAYATDEE